jgi:hypothetical protein
MRKDRESCRVLICKADFFPFPLLVRIDEVTHYNTQNNNYDTDNAPNNDGP